MPSTVNDKQRPGFVFLGTNVLGFFFTDVQNIRSAFDRGGKRNKMKITIHVNREPWLAISTSNQMEKQQLIDIHWQKVGLDPAKFY